MQKKKIMYVVLIEYCTVWAGDGKLYIFIGL